MSAQPQWKCVAQLGDVDPLEYGGYWVFVDETGVYSPEAELLEVPDSDDDGGFNLRRVYRFALEKCTFDPSTGVLSDNKFHPQSAAWFASPETEKTVRPQDTTYLSRVADYCGTDINELRRMLCSDDVCERAHAYREVGEFHGFDNLDSYPLELRRRETAKRYSDKSRYPARTVRG